MRRVEEYHKSRRMFCIIKGKLFIARPNLPYSHIDWFRKRGWIENANSINKITRGIVDKKGDIYFFIGKDFGVNKKAEKEFFEHLGELTKRLRLGPNTRIYGGMIRQRPGKQWPPKKRFGSVKHPKKIS
jgi:hypothetical protein